MASKTKHNLTKINCFFWTKRITDEINTLTGQLFIAVPGVMIVKFPSQIHLHTCFMCGKIFISRNKHNLRSDAFNKSFQFDLREKKHARIQIDRQKKALFLASFLSKWFKGNFREKYNFPSFWEGSKIFSGWGSNITITFIDSAEAGLSRGGGGITFPGESYSRFL